MYILLLIFIEAPQKALKVNWQIYEAVEMVESSKDSCQEFALFTYGKSKFSCQS